MKKVTNAFCTIICIVALLFSQNGYNIFAVAANNQYIEVDYKDLTSSSFLHASTMNKVTSGISRAASETYYINLKYQLSNGDMVYFTLELEFYDNYLFTPNGTDVALPRSSDPRTYYTYKYLTELPDAVREDINICNESEYPSIEQISQPTTSFNCHSYAWYSQNVSSNDIWMEYPNAYYSSTDLSYKPVDDPRAGDIICYFDLDETAETQNIHSGIIVGESGETSNNVCGDANMYTVQSKWGMGGTYIHKGDECPYVADADEVRYYRPNTNASYTLSSSMNDLSISRTINGSGSVTDKYGMYELNVTNVGQYTITIQSDDVLSNRLYNANMNLVSMTSPASSTGTYTYAVSLSAGRYYLRAAYTDTTNSGTISITIEPHSHSYDWWTYYNSTTHIESCCCGLTRTATAVHSIRASEVVNNKANCMGCGYMLDLRYDVAVSIPDSVMKVSVNGSYILPSGIIVLVDEDVEAYLNGTLVFYDKDDLPVTQ